MTKDVTRGLRNKMKIGDLVKFKFVPNSKTYLVYKVFNDKRSSCVFLIGAEGKGGAHTTKSIEVISEAG